MIKEAFIKGFMKFAKSGKKRNKPFGNAFPDRNKQNENPLKIPDNKTRVEAAKPGIQHTSGYK